MEREFNERPSHSRSFILTMWREGTPLPNGPPVWRIRLEDPRTAQRHGFVTLADLLSFLEAWVNEQNAHDD